MKRIKCIVAYDGTNFLGYQIQNQGRTVQGELEKVLKRMHKGERVPVYASGRTDTHVHALGQVIHFDSPLDLRLENWQKALNAQLPEDISILHVEFVPETFHARYSSIGKEYHYRVLLKKERDPFLRNYSYHFPYDVDVKAMRAGMYHFLGTHDFTSFSSAKSTVENRVRTINRFDVIEMEDELQFQIRGNGFLYNMVRIIIGTVLEVGTGKRDPNEIEKILERKDRASAGKTAPGCGLYLYKVFYE
ncbi:tRNA pseudouridine(38-40) synthase TruA [Fervidibacillus albus]|uniref:tRNA pseudouridine synthase A n=1 Tax=Fervidibacillus albus TaxID=2980026 RepID=A0A9E8LUH5_9BACI|nr:tRNA pseudouridine(38-40) synthase TruA [Fervidibacillus albus]WAA09401.1 tRNA pseudouridine(38-40) synthase TruA [Fervidibacillus albus]